MRWLVAVCLTACAAQLAPLTIINVRDFGATGAGATGDTAAIQAALQALRDGGTSVQVETADCVANPVVNNVLVDAGTVGPLLDLGTFTTTTGNSV